MKPALRTLTSHTTRARAIAIRMTLHSLSYRFKLLILPWRRFAERNVTIAPQRRPHAIAIVRWAAGAVDRYVPLVTCLSTALAARDELAAMGVASTIEIGAYATPRGTLRFHASVSAEGVPLDAHEPMIVLTTIGGEE